MDKIVMEVNERHPDLVERCKQLTDFDKIAHRLDPIQYNTFSQLFHWGDIEDAYIAYIKDRKDVIAIADWMNWKVPDVFEYIGQVVFVFTISVDYNYDHTIISKRELEDWYNQTTRTYEQMTRAIEQGKYWAKWEG